MPCKRIRQLKLHLWMILVGILTVTESQAACQLTMGYRTNERPPLIGEDPDDSGLYKELYQLAAQQIGCKLEIVRLPKNRVMGELRSGVVDFYPGLNFTHKRAEFAFFVENGLPGGDVGVSRADLPEVRDLSQLQGKTLLVALGSPEWNAEQYGLKVFRVSELSIDRALQLLAIERADFFIYNRSSLDYALRQRGKNGFKLHHRCCGGDKPLYLGFSRKSKHYREMANEDFKPQQVISATNRPNRLAPDSIVWRFSQALVDMKKRGITDALYQKYY